MIEYVLVLLRLSRPEASPDPGRESVKPPVALEAPPLYFPDEQKCQMAGFEIKRAFSDPVAFTCVAQELRRI